MNEEFPVNASYKFTLIMSLTFVHSARHYYRLNDLVRFSDWCTVTFSDVNNYAGKMIKFDHLKELKIVTVYQKGIPGIPNI